MTKRNRYFGVEQEFISFSGNDQVDVTGYFGKINKSERPYFKRSDTALRSRTGHAIYADGREVEVCTPPIRINEGFASRVTDLVVMGREKIVNALPHLKHTGYSMHWNLSSPEVNPYFYSGIAIPFHLFGLTPLSGGLNVRTKDEDSSGKRVEVLGDAIVNEEQINATALMLGSFLYACDVVEGFPLITDGSRTLPTSNRIQKFLSNGRYSNVEVALRERDGVRRAEMTAQTALECFYEFIKPVAKKLGTKREVENLEAFIYGDKQLEFDKFKFFACLRSFDGIEGRGMYMPIEFPGKANPSRIVKLSGKKRNLPIEGRLLGGIVDKKLGELNEMEWGVIRFNQGQNIDGQDFARLDEGRSGRPFMIYALEGIDEIYDFAAKLLGEQKMADSPTEEEIRALYDPIRTNLNVNTKGPMRYNERRDKFELPNEFVLRNAIRESEIFTRKGFVRTAVATGIIGLLSLLGNIGYEWHQTSKGANEVIRKYTQPSTNIVVNVQTNTNVSAKVGGKK